jgi:replicative DNA helicase
MARKKVGRMTDFDDTIPDAINSLQSPHAEEALLASVLVDPNCFSSIDIESNDFYLQKNAHIWLAMQRIVRGNHNIDFITVCNELENAGVLNNVGGPSEIMRILGASASSFHVKSYVDIIKNKSQRRKLVRSAEKIANAAIDEKCDIDIAIPEHIESLVNAMAGRNGARPLDVYLSELYDEVKMRSENPKDIWGIPTGFPKFDNLTGGFQKSEIFIVSGEPGIGKSLWVMQVATQMARHSPGAIYSIEMKGLQVVRRMVSGAGMIPSRSMKTGRMSDQDWESFTETIGELSKLPVYMDDSDYWTTTSLRADLQRQKITHGIEWFILDYMFLLQDGWNLGETERTAMASRGLKSICKSLDLAGVAVHSMTKMGMGQEGAPTQDNLRGSGQVIHDADDIGFLTYYKPDMDKDSLVKIKGSDKDNIRVLWISKGRDMDKSKQTILFVQKPGFPAFREYVSERG